MIFSEERLDRFLGQMAMPGADIDHMRIGRGGSAGHGFPQPLVDDLSNQMLHHGPVQSAVRRSHKLQIRGDLERF